MLSVLQMKYWTSIDARRVHVNHARPISASSPFSRIYTPVCDSMRVARSSRTGFDPIVDRLRVQRADWMKHEKESAEFQVLHQRTRKIA